MTSLKTTLKTYLPPSVLAFSQALRYRNRPIRSIFTKLYYEPNCHLEVISGPGSDLIQTAAIVRELPRLLEELRVQTLLDAPCGDFHWMQHVDLGTAGYLGIDIVEEQVRRNQLEYARPGRRFRCLDVTADPLPRTELILSRDLLVHLSFRDLEAALRNFKRSMSEYLLTTTFPQLEKNADILTGNWRPINLQLPPFNFPSPRRLINEQCTENDGLY
ncbi:MAG TPA: class I SAM-dependent methyltransferase, partial [Blastocatellia bacterium]|nr:class I SAM-dependent methyltransferase [Blastocatellia bacterium]